MISGSFLSFILCSFTHVLAQPAVVHVTASKPQAFRGLASSSVVLVPSLTRRRAEPGTDKMQLSSQGHLVPAFGL